MARRPAADRDRNTGVYAWLLDRERAKAARLDREIGGAVYRYPRHRLAALQADQPVTIPAWLLPRWAGHPGSHDVTVHPDDRIALA